MSYIVLVRGVDDTYDAYGPFRNLAKAESLVERFNARVEEHERTHPESADGIAWAYVLDLHTASSKLGRLVVQSGMVL